MAADTFFKHLGQTAMIAVTVFLTNSFYFSNKDKNKTDDKKNEKSYYFSNKDKNKTDGKKNEKIKDWALNYREVWIRWF